MPSLVTPRFSRFSFNLNQVLSPKPHADNDVDNSRSRPLQASSTSATPSPVDAQPACRHTWSSFPALDSKMVATTSKTEVTATNIEKSLSTPRKSLKPQLYAIEYHDTTSSPQTLWAATFTRNAASTRDETRYLANCSLLRHARVLLASLLTAGSVAVLGMQVDTYRRYTHSLLPPDSTGWALRVWPHNLNLTPTILLIVVSAVNTLLNLAYLLTAIIPTPTRRRWQPTLFTTTALSTFILTLITLIYIATTTPQSLFSSFVRAAQTTTVKTLDTASTTGLSMSADHTRPDTIYTFTCHIVHSARAFQSDTTHLRLPSLSRVSMATLIPTGFPTLCEQNRASIVLIVALVTVGFTSLLTAALGYINDRWIRGERTWKSHEMGGRTSRKSSKSSRDSKDGAKTETETEAGQSA